MKRLFFIGISSSITPRKFYLRIPLTMGTITGMQPSPLHRLGGRTVISPVSQHPDGSLNADFAGFAGRKGPVVPIPDRYGDAARS